MSLFKFLKDRGARLRDVCVTKSDELWQICASEHGSFELRNLQHMGLAQVVVSGQFPNGMRMT